MSKHKKNHTARTISSAIKLSRRVAIGGTFSAIAALLSSRAFAQNVHSNRKRVKRYMEGTAKKQASEPPKSWIESIMPGTQTNPSPTANAQPSSPLFIAARYCLDQGSIARNYCLDRLKSGDATVKPCLDKIQAMLPVCNALAKLAELKATRTKHMAKAAIIFLSDCEKECQKLAQIHSPLLSCALACNRCNQECKKAMRA